MGAYCNLKGRVIALFFILQAENAYYLIMPRDIIPTLLEQLQKFIVFSKAELTDVSDQMFAYTSILPSDVGVASYATRMPAGHGQIMLAPSPDLQPEHETNELEWQKYLIEYKIPTITLQQSEKFLPHYINLLDLGAVSFDKGCFKGQEVIARMHYRGKLKKQLEFHKVEGGIPEEVGEVVNSVSDGNTHYVLSIVSL